MGQTMECEVFSKVSWIFYVLACFFFFSTAAGTNPVQNEIREYCLGKEFKAVCQDNEVILMTHAVYGRMGLGTCIKDKYRMGCSRNVLPYMDQKCSGRKHCAMFISDFVNDNVDSCDKDVTSYLEAAYKCIKVISVKPTECMSSPVLVLAPDGYLASKVTYDTKIIGTSPCPWALQVKRGQTINITLYDFGVYAARSFDGHNLKYFIITEPGNSQQQTVYGGDQRVKGVYTSTSHELLIDLFVTSAPKTAPNFLIQYEVIGCADPPLPPHSRLERSGTKQAKVICEHTSVSWDLDCKEHSWVGKVGNCSLPGVIEEEPTVWMILFGEDWSSPTGVLIVIGFGVALGIIIGLILLAVAIICMRRMNYFDEKQKMGQMEADMIIEDPSSPCKFSTKTDTQEISSTYQEPLVRDSVQRVYADGVYRASLTSQDSWPRTTGSGQPRSKYLSAPQHIYETPDNTNGCHS